MCFTGSIFLSKKKIAKEDIICYKCGYIDAHDEKFPKFNPAFYTDYFYLKDYLQPKLYLEKDKRFLFWFNIDKGYHSFKHFKNPLTQCVIFSEANIEKFIIPKGSIYYENRTDYVSNTIKWVGN